MIPSLPEPARMSPSPPDGIPINRRVLVVDDEAHVPEGVRMALRRRFDVVPAVGADEAMRLLASGEFAVVLSDLRMPGTDGIALLRRVRDLHPDPVRMMWSGHADLHAALEAVNTGGVYRFVLKPLSPDALAAELEAGIAEFRRRQAEKALALQDPLLKIPGRRAFDQALAAAHDAGRGYGVLMVDVDQFKVYNDSYGHVAGDCALIGVAGAIRAAAANRGQVCRYGGEELAVITPSGEPGAFAALAEDIRRAVRAVGIPHSRSAHGVVTISVGGALHVGGTVESPAEVVQRADQALYRSKHGGRDRVSID